MGSDPYAFQYSVDLDPYASQYWSMDPSSEFLNPQTMDPSSSSSPSSFSSAGILQSLSHELEKQTMEMDILLQYENERIRNSILLEEARQRQVIMEKYESEMERRMLQLDEQLLGALNRAKELEDSLQAAENEARQWRSEIAEKEAMVCYLRKELDAAKEATSYCDSASSSTEVRNATMDCKLCGKRRLRSVFLPCRHLCCCERCEKVLEQCPDCGTGKEGSLEVYL